MTVYALFGMYKVGNFPYLVQLNLYKYVVLTTDLLNENRMYHTSPYTVLSGLYKARVLPYLAPCHRKIVIENLKLCSVKFTKNQTFN